MSKKTTQKNSSESAKPAEKGHNRTGGLNAEKLQSLVERYERLDEEKSAIADDQKEVRAEVKANGYDPKIFLAIIKLRKSDRGEVSEYFHLLDTYARALGFSFFDLEVE